MIKILTVISALFLSGCSIYLDAAILIFSVAEQQEIQEIKDADK
jgi:hypothetical protein